MRRFMIPLIAAVALALPVAAASQAGGLSPKQLSDAGWFCFDAGSLGLHCAPPGKWPPTGPNVQLLYFLQLHAVTDTPGFFTGVESLLRDDFYHGQPCPTTATGEYNPLGDLGLGGPSYWACHRS